jgi:hypothetical protein
MFIKILIPNVKEYRIECEEIKSISNPNVEFILVENEARKLNVYIERGFFSGNGTYTQFTIFGNTHKYVMHNVLFETTIRYNDKQEYKFSCFRMDFTQMNIKEIRKEKIRELFNDI